MSSLIKAYNKITDSKVLNPMSSQNHISALVESKFQHIPADAGLTDFSEPSVVAGKTWTFVAVEETNAK